MKKLLLIFILLIFSSKLISQDSTIESLGMTVADEMIEITGGQLGNTQFENGRYTVVIRLPRFYNFDLIKTDVRDFIKKYDNVRLLEPWRKYDSRLFGYGQLAIVNNVYWIMFYFVPPRQFVFSVFIPKNKNI